MCIVDPEAACAISNTNAPSSLGGIKSIGGLAVLGISEDQGKNLTTLARKNAPPNSKTPCLLIKNLLQPYIKTEPPVIIIEVEGKEMLVFNKTNKYIPA